MSDVEYSTAGERQPGRVMVGRLIAALLVAIGVMWLLRVPFHLGLAIIPQEYLGGVMALTLLAAFHVFPLPGRLGTLADIVLSLVGAAAWFWMALNADAWLLDVTGRGPEKTIPAVIGILVLCEAVRRASGGVMAGVAVTFLLYGLLGKYLPGMLAAAPVAWDRYFAYLYTDVNAIPGLLLNVGATDLLGFILFGAALGVIGSTRVLTDIALATMGHRRGGSAKAAIVASSVFGTLSGSTVANVMSTGAVTIPLMKRSGYSPAYAAGVEAVASNGGQIAPPVMGATAFVMAEFLQIPYSEVAIAAAVPALIYYVALFLQVNQYARVHGLRGEAKDTLPQIGAVLWRGWPMLLPLPVLIYFLFWAGASPGRAALYSAAAGVICDIISRVLRRQPLALARYLSIPMQAGSIVIQLLLICACAGIVIGTVNLTGVAFTITLNLAMVGEVAGLWALLGATAVIAIILGLGMPTIGVYIILSVLLAPAMMRLGVEPVAAHFFVLYFGLLSMLTPPVAIASYAAASLAGSNLWQTSVRGVQLALPAYIMPFVFVLNPSILTHENWTSLVLGAVTIVIAPLVAAVPFSLERHTVWWRLRYPLLVLGLLIGLSSAFTGGAVNWISVGALIVGIGLYYAMSVSGSRSEVARTSAAAQ